MSQTGELPWGHRVPRLYLRCSRTYQKDASQFFLNPAGAVLATSIRYSEGQAQWGAQPMPPPVVNALLPFFPAALLQSVSWNVPDGRLTLDTVLLNEFNQGASAFLAPGCGNPT